ncbi:uncharacterized protein LOC128551590 [Mercenaria mercenaria]|uniref:uncharacterized protein LOC128551590 n=1 Tax=Mercenaria mercenaria TaxID=6596 RepID=UPI00234E59F0|nr:uncharacterized protein LOC128551590 [Mercenaria mercenaria]
MKLKSKKLLTQDQTNMLIPPQGQGQTNIKKWDLTLLSLMLTEMFKQQLQLTEVTNINVIRRIRNNLQHISGTCQITETEFVNMYQQLQSIIVQLALSAKGQGYADKIKQDIETAANSALVDLGDVLRQWYMAEISKLKDEIEQLKDKIDEIQEDTTETRKTLKKTTVKRTRSGGKITKRFKTVDHILENMRGSFWSLIKNELESDFQSPPEATRITSELEEHHLVVVSGYGKGLYLQTALSVIDSRDYDEDRCVLVSTPPDWRHIGAEDADLVVFLHPFGKNQFDDDKAKSMNAVLDSIKSSVSVNDEDELFDVIIITDQSILDECKKHFSHDLIENPIIVYKPTTEDTPVDLVEGESAMYQVGTDPHYRNLLVQSIAYCKHHKMQLVDNNLKEDALVLFRSKKVIVISGPRGSGKTTLALSLLSSYQEGHYLILTEPGDLRCIRFGVTCVVVIEDLGGKYTSEMAVVQKWLRKFDMLYSAVKDGKLNIIITCVPDKLSGIAKKSKHPILEAVLTLPKRRVVKIKQEPSSDAYGEKCAEITFSKR